VASQNLKNTFWVQNFLFCAQAVLGIPEPPREAHNNIGGSKPAPWRWGLFIFLVMQKANPAAAHITVINGNRFTFETETVT
jgi:hypothetical protein